MLRQMGNGTADWGKKRFSHLCSVGTAMTSHINVLSLPHPSFLKPLDNSPFDPPSKIHYQRETACPFPQCHCGLKGQHRINTQLRSCFLLLRLCLARTAKVMASLPRIFRDYMLDRWMGSIESVVYRKDQRTMEVPSQTCEEPLKSRSLWKWCFASNGLNGEISRLHKLLVNALPYQWCQAWGNSNCSWAGDRQILPQKSLCPLPYHPAPPPGSGTHPQTTAMQLLCPFHGRVWDFLFWWTHSGMLSNYMEAERLLSLPQAVQKLS